MELHVFQLSASYCSVDDLHTLVDDESQLDVVIPVGDAVGIVQPSKAGAEEEVLN